MWKIKIVDVPKGEAPYSVRQRWVGVELRAFYKTESHGFGVLSQTPVEGQVVKYCVYVDEALCALELHDGPKGEASLWWKAWKVSPMAVGMGAFGFEASVCKVLEDEL